ncbi:MAG: hypothetical protein JRN07_00720 [Nitrososphaerota archaeon]|nr:hypothetical protein [Nitrososphaerota archaeon]
MSLAQVATTSVEEIGSGGIYTTAVTIEAPAPGFLCVRVVTDRLLREQKGLTIKFYPGDAYGNVKGAQIGADATTDDHGVAGLDQRQPQGYFAAVVDGMTVKVRPIDVQTYAEALARPYLLGLPRGFLGVRLVFRDLGLEGFKVRFFKAARDGTKDGPALGEKVTEFSTKGDGVASVEGEEFRLGNYLCEVGGQTVATVSTVEDLERPYVLPLPTVRSLLEHEEPGRLEGEAEVGERGESGGYLSARVMFRGAPMRGVDVAFYQADATGLPATKEPRGLAATDSEGVATLSSRARLGNYFCQVEGIEGFFSLSTVEDPGRPYVVSFPFVRPSLLHVSPGEVSAVAVEERPEPSSGFLAVRVLFRGSPLAGRRVAFCAAGPDGLPATEDREGDAFTDSEGVAVLDSRVRLGNYFCQVEGQQGLSSVSTVEERSRPYVLALPAGRPLLTVREAGRIEDQESRVEERQATAGAYLSVMVLFRGSPAKGLKVQFFAASPAGVPDLDQPRGEATTDRTGVAALDAAAKPGAYFCQVEAQSDYFSIGTVEDRDLPYVVKLPQGRPLLVHLAPGAVPELPAVQERDPPPPDP